MTRGRLPAETERLRTSFEEAQSNLVEIVENAVDLHVRLCDALATLNYGRERTAEHPTLVQLIEARRFGNGRDTTPAA